MKVVINTEWGGFDLSNEAIKECIARGMTVAKKGAPGYTQADFIERDEYYLGRQYFLNKKHEKEFRCNPILVQVVELMGVKASPDLEIIDIPFDSTDGWYIANQEGAEEICENHRSWGAR